MKTSSREEFKQEIIIKALEIVSTIGVDQVSLRQIADHVGLKQTALLHHYGSKNKIVHECILAIVQRNSEIVLNCLKTRKGSQIKSYIRGNINWALDNRSQAGLILYLYYRASFDDSYRALYAKIKDAALQKISNFLKADGLSGNSDKASLIHDALLGGILHLIVEPLNIKPRDISDLEARLSRIIFKL
jgi:AcrR family transcriptional regulator